MAETCAADSVEKEPMPPKLPLMADWIFVVVAPALAEEANAPWQPAQLPAYRALPSVADGVVGGVVGVVGEETVASAVAMAATCAADSEEKEPMPPELPLMADWILVVVAPALAEEVSAPWQPAHLSAYRALPSIAAGVVGGVVGVGVEGVRAVTIA